MQTVTLVSIQGTACTAAGQHMYTHAADAIFEAHAESYVKSATPDSRAHHRLGQQGLQ